MHEMLTDYGHLIADRNNNLITDKIIGERCKNVRKLKKITQTYIAKDLGITQSLVSKFESGERFNYPLLLYYYELGVRFYGWLHIYAKVRINVRRTKNKILKANKYKT